MEDSDQELLRRFAGHRDQRAFQMLVQRHLGMVHATARRVTASGDLAQDVAQTTFVRLAQQATTLATRPVPLAAWLHRTCRSQAIDLVRSETRRRRREEKAFRDLPAPMDDARTEPYWESIAPVLDELVNRLPARDRELLLLRYYENHSHAAVAGALGLSEQVARMRCLRALEKLRALLQRRGIATTSAALSTLLPAYGSGTASPALTAAVMQATQGIAPLAPAGLLSQALTGTATHRATLAALAVMLGTAALVVELFPRPATSARSTAAAPPPPASPLRPPPTPTWTAATALETLQAVDTHRLPAPQPLGLDDVLKDWTIPELRTALELALRSPDLALTNRSSNETLKLLVTAWMKKDIPGFLAWQGGVKNESQRDLLTSMTTSHWPENKGEEALAYALEQRGTSANQDRAWDAKAMKMAMEQRAGNGPAAVADCLRIAIQNDLEMPQGYLNLPRDFDFKTLIATPEVAALWNRRNASQSMERDELPPNGALLSLLMPWWRRDRDEAFDTLLARGRELGSLPADYYYPYIYEQPSPEDADWLAGKMKDMTAEERTAVLKGNAQLLTWQRSGLETLIEAMAAFPDDVHLLHEIGASAIQRRGFAAVLPHLEALGDPAARVSWLEKATLIPEPAFSELDREQETTLMKSKLAEWQATPGQIEAITSRIHFSR